MQMELSLRDLRGSVEKEQKPITEEGANLLRRVRRGEPGAEEEFARLHSDRIRFDLRGRLGPYQRLEIDGGIDPATIEAAVTAGADTLVAGSAIFGHPDPPAAMKELKRLAVAACGRGSEVPR